MPKKWLRKIFIARRTEVAEVTLREFTRTER
jgi:hypothetical protein